MRLLLRCSFGMFDSDVWLGCLAGLAHSCSWHSSLFESRVETDDIGLALPKVLPNNAAVRDLEARNAGGCSAGAVRTMPSRASCAAACFAFARGGIEFHHIGQPLGQLDALSLSASVSRPCVYNGDTYWRPCTSTGGGTEEMHGSTAVCSHHPESEKERCKENGIYSRKQRRKKTTASMTIEVLPNARLSASAVVLCESREHWKGATRCR